MRAYANGWYTVERTPQEFHAAAKRVLAKGYRAVKLDPFGAGFYEIDREEQVRSVGLVEAVRDAVGPDVGTGALLWAAVAAKVDSPM